MNADAKLDTIIGLLRQIAAAVEQPTPEPRRNGLSQGDRAILAKLLPAISAAVKDLVFETADLEDEARSKDELRAVLEGLNSRQLGKLFARARDVSIAGCRVERVGDGRGVALWRVRQ